MDKQRLQGELNLGQLSSCEASPLKATPAVASSPRLLSISSLSFKMANALRGQPICDVMPNSEENSLGTRLRQPYYITHSNLSE